LPSTPFAHEDDAIIEQRPHLVFAVRVLVGLAHLRGDDKPFAPARRDTRRDVYALVGIHPTEEQRVAAWRRYEREVTHIDPMVNYPGDRDVGRRAARRCV
jgi:hypothetical protein